MTLVYDTLLQTLRKVFDHSITIAAQFIERHGSHGLTPHDAIQIDQVQQVFSSAFFAEWFRKEGTAYLFVFKKNLRVTNIQFAELLALLRTHASPRRGKPLLYLSSSTFRQAVRLLLRTFAGRSADPPLSLAQVYAPLFERAVVIEPLFGSCAVYMPPGMRLDLELLCAEAGYIHSCGPLVFLRKAYKATQLDLMDAVRAHLGQTPLTKPVRFIVYAHEHFDPLERSADLFLRDGLNDLKIFIEKFHLGDTRLIEVLKTFPDDLASSVRPLRNPVEIDGWKPPYWNTEIGDCDDGRTLWLIVDGGVASDGRQRGPERYYVCYEQRFKNENPFHYFDENKPAWVDHTTIPHTLMGAMINVTQPWGNRISLVDPFVGSGTTWLESLKFGTRCQVMCSDLEPIAATLARDNLEFFALPSKRLRKYIEFLSEVRASLEPATYSAEASATVPYARARELYCSLRMQYRDAEATLEYPPAFVRRLREESLETRLMFYIALRAEKRHAATAELGQPDNLPWRKAYSREAALLAACAASLADLRDAEERTGRQDRPRVTSRLFQDAFSLATTYGSEALGQAETRVAIEVVERNVLSLGSRTCDVIVADPPYGFNTAANADQLARLYADFIPRLVDAVRGTGQIVMALPDWSHNGQQFPYFTHKDIVLRQVLLAAEAGGRELVRGTVTVPEPDNLYRPPYFWESERALRRAILHFKIRDRSGRATRRRKWRAAKEGKK